MVVAQFLRWIDTAKVSDRAAAAAALARAFLTADLTFEDRCAAEAALTFLLDDPSWKVRRAMAEVLSMAHNSPPQVIAALAADQPDVAGVVLARSPVLTDADLIDRVASGDEAAQHAVALRADISMAVAAALGEVGTALACTEMLRNGCADIAPLTYRRMAERLGDDALVREAMLDDPALPSECRHTLMLKVGAALKQSPLVVALMGNARAEKVAREACARASVTLVERAPAAEHPALVEHLRIRGELTPGFIVRAVAAGKIDFLGSVLVSLTGQSVDRIRALLAAGRDSALSALFRTARLPASIDAAVLSALRIWREVANGRRVAGVQEVSWLMLKALESVPGHGEDAAAREVAKLIRSIHLDELRANARGHAMLIAAA